MSEKDLESEINEEPYIDKSVKTTAKRKKIIKITEFSMLGLILAAYITGVIYHYICFAPNTKINGYDVSNMTIKQVDSIISDEWSEYVLQIDFKNTNKKLSKTDGDITFNLTIKLSECQENPFLWIFNIGKEQAYEIPYEVIYEKETIIDTLSTYSELDKTKMIESTNARIDLSTGEAVVIDDITGTVLDEELLYEKVFEALDNYEFEVSASECYIEAEITSDSDFIAKALEKANNFLAIEAKYLFGDYVLRLTPEELGGMAYVDYRGNVRISQSLVNLFVIDFAKKYDTVGTTRKFKRHDGKYINIGGGYYGWRIDVETEATELYDILIKKKNFEKEPACTRKGYSLSDINDIGDNYIEIDLENQHVYVISNGKKVFDTPCVSGNLSWGMSTPGGIYPLTYKERHATLNGADYSTQVAYWMPFNGDIGMHDATWKTKFGEDYYKYDGSHGCINLPLNAAATIFEYVEQGTPVVCYWERDIIYE